MWQVIAERVRGEHGWPTELNTLFELTRRKVEAGTHVMCTRFVERMNPDTWELEEFEQRVVKQCRKPLQPFEFWSEPDREEWLKTESRRQSREISQKHKAGKRG